MKENPKYKIRTEKFCCDYEYYISHEISFELISQEEQNTHNGQKESWQFFGKEYLF